MPSMMRMPGAVVLFGCLAARAAEGALALQQDEALGQLGARSRRIALRATRAAARVGRAEESACTCDCCVSQFVGRAAVAVAEAGRRNKDETQLVCVPRAGEIQGPDGDGGCSQTCQVSEENRSSFNIVSNAVDYSRFCTKECDSFADADYEKSAAGLLCAPKAYQHIMEGKPEVKAVVEPVALPPPPVPVGRVSGDVIGATVQIPEGAQVAGPAIEPGTIGVTIPGSVLDPATGSVMAGWIKVRWETGVEASYRVGADQQFDLEFSVPPPTTTSLPYKEGAISDAILKLARSKMVEARRHAEAAGMGAKAAKRAYEVAVASAQAMGRAAGQATYNEIQQKAGKQAWEALQLRERYVEDAQQIALKQAEDAAQVYEKARTRDIKLAGIWGDRSKQFEKAAAERRQAEKVAEEQAEKYGEAGDWSDQRDYTIRARNAADMAVAYEQQVGAARDEAEAISNRTSWYAVAAQAAEAHELAVALPPGVPLPALPPPAQ